MPNLHKIKEWGSTPSHYEPYKLNIMDKAYICSPPVSTEERLINIPGDTEEDTFFTFHFNIRKTGNKVEVTFTLALNPELSGNEALSSPPAPPETYTFGRDQRCTFEHVTPEGYYAKGTLQIISFNTPIGQFDDNHKNFLFNIETGYADDTPHGIKGLFGLINPAAAQDNEHQ